MPPKVLLCPHDSCWEIVFGREAKAIKSVVPPELCLGIEHFGSTAVPGLIAKPIIDMVVGLPSLSVESSLIRCLSRVKYEFVPELRTRYPDILYFHKGRVELRSFHLHAVIYQGPTWNRYLGFRNALRRDPVVRIEYQEVKKVLAAIFPNDRASYTEGKRAFIDQVVNGLKNKIQ